MEEESCLVALDKRTEQPALLVLPGLLVELFDLQVPETVASPVPLYYGGTVRLILLP